MKKIIATVLAMVMALALCTTAFAATTYKVGENEVVEKTAANYVTRYVDKTTGDVYVTDANGDQALIINDVESEIMVSLASAENNYGKYSITAKAVEAPDAADQKCGDVINEELYVANGVYYDAVEYDEDDTKLVWLNVDGSVVCAKACSLVLSDVVNHTLVAVYGDDGKVTGFTCSKCDATLAYTKTKSEALKSGKLFDTKEVGTTTYYVMYAAAATAPTTDGKADSPKTFDAGIAMYVGMALTSVAGSAVVIGKKKEF